MTFSTVADLAIYAVNTSQTNHTPPYPATVSANQLLLYMAGCDGSEDTPSISGSGITELYSGTETSHGSCVYYKDAVGDEDGGTFALTVGSTEQVMSYCLAITGWDGVTAPELQGPATGVSANPDPPIITPSWGAEDTLFVTFITTDGNVTVTTYPSGYADNNNDDQWSTVSAAFATAEINGSPENPGTFLVSSAIEQWSAFTIAIRPASVTTTLPGYHGANRGIMRGVARGVG